MFNRMQCFEYNLMLSYFMTLFSQELASISYAVFYRTFCLLKRLSFLRTVIFPLKQHPRGSPGQHHSHHMGMLYNRQQLEALPLIWTIPFLDFGDKCSNMVGKKSFLWSLSLASPQARSPSFALSRKTSPGQNPNRSKASAT